MLVHKYKPALETFNEETGLPTIRLAPRAAILNIIITFNDLNKDESNYKYKIWLCTRKRNSHKFGEAFSHVHLQCYLWNVPFWNKDIISCKY